MVSKSEWYGAFFGRPSIESAPFFPFLSVGRYSRVEHCEAAFEWAIDVKSHVVGSTAYDFCVEASPG